MIWDGGAESCVRRSEGEGMACERVLAKGERGRYLTRIGEVGFLLQEDEGMELQLGWGPDVIVNGKRKDRGKNVRWDPCVFWCSRV